MGRSRSKRKIPAPRKSSTNESFFWREQQLAIDRTTFHSRFNVDELLSISKRGGANDIASPQMVRTRRNSHSAL